MKIVALATAIALTIPAVAFATGQEVCPDGGDWVKVDGLSGLTYTHEAPDGYEVTDNCYKAATSVVYGTGETVTSTIKNPRGKCCQDLSHASFKLAKIEQPPVEDEEEPEEEAPAEENPVEETPVVKTSDEPVFELITEGK
jgi:hypothetical protein